MAATPTILEYERMILVGFRKLSKIKRTSIRAAMRIELVFWLFNEGKLASKKVSDIVAGLFSTCRDDESQASILSIAKCFGVSESTVSENASFLISYFREFWPKYAFVVRKGEKCYCFSRPSIVKKNHNGYRDEIMNRLNLKGSFLAAKSFAEQASKDSLPNQCADAASVSAILTDRFYGYKWEIAGDELKFPSGESKLYFTNPVSLPKVEMWYSETNAGRLRVEIRRLPNQTLEVQIKREVGDSQWELLALHSLSLS